ncbi:MAG: polyprenyl synthetase family protein [Alphaproteobacteria bacterium]
MTPAALDRRLASRRREVDAALRLALGRGTDAPARLRSAMRWSLLGPGKRIRPVLVLEAASLVAGARGRALALDAACALEMVHAYSLVHDDLPAMDDDRLRRGRPTTHVRFDEATAILAGDALLTEAFSVLAGPAGGDPGREAPRRLRVVAELAAAAGASGMVGGQAMDLASEGRARVGAALVAGIHRRKTGALIRAAVRAGAICAGADARTLGRLTVYGEALGLAFQIADDVLDATASTAVTGKRRGGDEERGKATYPAALGLDGARSAMQRAAEDARSAIRPFGDRAAVLRALVDRVVERAA